MIISYLAVHHVEEYDGQESHDVSRALGVLRSALRHGVSTRLRPDGDTTYVEAHLFLASLDGTGEKSPHLLDENDDLLWSEYVDFLMELEDSNLGYLLHEVHTSRERELIQTLEETGDDSPSLRYVDVAYRFSVPEERTGQRH